MKTVRKLRSSLDIRFPVTRCIDCHLAKKVLYPGKLLGLQWIADGVLAVISAKRGEDLVIGIIPKGMIPHMEIVVENSHEYCIELESVDCTQLENYMWIKVRSLHHITI